MCLAQRLQTLLVLLFFAVLCINSLSLLLILYPAHRVVLAHLPHELRPLLSRLLALVLIDIASVQFEMGKRARYLG